MKIWWPWHRKRFQSLFNRSIEDGGDAQLIHHGLNKPHPKNAAGPFYVIDTECIICGAPHAVAPDLIAWELDAQGRPEHCYFKKQPEDEYELTQAISAVALSCCGAVCYGGSDPEIIKRLRKAGAGNSIIRSR